MPNCKKYYSNNIDKYHEMRRKEKANYRERTGSGLYEKRLWDADEEDAVLKQDKTDRELSALLQRSVLSIQIHRTRLRKKIYENRADRC